LTPEQALTAFTLGSAYINQAEGDRGSIAVGRVADLAILDRDPLREGFREARVRFTIVGGEIVYRRP
jgi:predicted amidohydrolase YtcJ